MMRTHLPDELSLRVRLDAMDGDGARAVNDTRARGEFHSAALSTAS